MAVGKPGFSLCRPSTETAEFPTWVAVIIGFRLLQENQVATYRFPPHPPRSLNVELYVEVA